MEQNSKKIISVLLTRYFSTFSNIIYWISGRGYTHASISLNDEYFYSFNLKGFRREYPKRRVRKCGRSVCYKLEVSEENFQKVRDRIEKMEENKEEFSYSRLGIILCMLHIPCKIKNSYFCSQFVVEMLELSGSVMPEKNASLYLPNQLPRMLGKSSSLKEIICNPV